jgi:hypothetical protein
LTAQLSYEGRVVVEGAKQGWQKPGVFKKNQPGWVFLGFIGVFGVLLFFFNFCPIKSIFWPVFVLFNYLLADEFKIK